MKRSAVRPFDRSAVRGSAERPLAGAKRMALLEAMADVADVSPTLLYAVLHIPCNAVPGDVCDCLIELIARLPIATVPAQLPAPSSQLGDRP